MATETSSIPLTDQMPMVALPAAVLASVRRKPMPARRQPRRPVIISEELFRGVLIKERKRVDRLNQPLILLTVAVNDRQSGHAPSIWVPVLEALAAVTRDTDILGWFEWRGAIGVILPEIRTIDAAKASQLDARLCGELIKRSNAETASRFSIRLHVHPPEPRRMEAAARPEAESVDFPDLQSPPVRWSVHDTVKRGLDVFGSSTLLLVLAPVFLLIAVAVKARSRGPIFFGQMRVGQRMKSFTMLKFRTMHPDADQKLHHEYVTRFINAAGAAHDAGRPGFFKLSHDPRVTPIGHFLRKTSLDELPQLWNVLRGDMSLVGPRPPLPYEVEQYKPWHCRRVVDAKPGITGLWQVSGRSRTTFDDMVRLDLRYARTRSLWTDIKILAATPAAVIAGKGAC
jgi:lipopolysaccharide/colanic/teichoic acid biosynthesis glycosyltransferase